MVALNCASAAPTAAAYNSMIAIAPSGAVLTHYDKWHLVPFGEYAPPIWFFGLKISPGTGFTAGAGPATLHPPGFAENLTENYAKNPTTFLTRS